MFDIYFCCPPREAEYFPLFCCFTVYNVYLKKEVKEEEEVECKGNAAGGDDEGEGGEINTEYNK